MTHDEIEAICTERLARWKHKLVDCHATPVILIGCGHDHAKGDVHLVTLENLTTPKLETLLRVVRNQVLIECQRPRDRRPAAGRGN